ncbi:hypothetical protein HC752_23095 [Vibrio sp. S9_S30]|uniref:hypothetical protein n=1 Tax=Vibrio sp. S9_S30 TaxID=2720226 RepID=UPI001680C696|nr:hypothetical protein [Vibrio sp. S9_S30]MBD1559821.1 hypothetical protein [Vibrio sp. S9_S30]
MHFIFRLSAYLSILTYFFLFRAPISFTPNKVVYGGKKKTMPEEVENILNERLKSG